LGLTGLENGLTEEGIMPEQTKPQDNTFCWVEVMTTDLAAGRKFYEDLFDWKTSDVRGTQPYAVAMNGDKMVAGLGILGGEAKKAGTPPSWLSYVAVDNAADGAKKIESLGGKVLVGPLDTDMGNMVIAQDPTGAVFALWQQKQSMGTFQYGEVGSVGWSELLTNNVDRARSFYTNLFGWKPEPGQNPEIPYTVFKVGDRLVGGMMAITKDMVDAPPAWWVYFSVDDCDATLAKAKKLGGRIKRPGTDIPNIGRFGILADPQGAVFAVMKMLPMPTK
jgi:uncharacterized protein